jgi:PEGA domain-containing protein
MEANEIPPLPAESEVPAALEDKWLEAFYKECGREVTLAYTTLNQMKNFAMIAVAAAISGTAFSKDANRFPDERMFVGIVIVYVFVLRFFFRAIICYINLTRWNTLQNACAQLKLIPDARSGAKTKLERESEFRYNYQHFYVQWLSPISRNAQIVSNLRLGFGLLFALPVFFGTWGLISLWRSPIVEGMTVFALGITLVEVYDFFTSEIFDSVKADSRRQPNRKASNYYPTPAARSFVLLQWLAVAVISVTTALVQEQRLKLPAMNPPPPNSSTLILSSDPTAAIVYIDGVRKGTTPLLATVAPGNRTIETRQSGFIPSSVSIDLIANQSQTVFIRLRKR